MKARSSLCKVKIRSEISQASACRTPFIEVARHNRRKLARFMIDRGQDRMRLPSAPKSGKIQMHTDDTDLTVSDLDVGNHRPARLKRWKVDDPAIGHPGALADENRIPMPTKPADAHIEIHGLPGAVFDQQMRREGGLTRAEPSIRLLQDHDIGIDLA